MDDSQGYVSADHPPLEAPGYCYWLSGAGIALARLLGLGKVLMYFFGKALVFLGYLAAGFFTIRLMPFAKNLAFLVYLLPISIQQATSFSYDTTVNALAFLLTAYCLHLTFAVDKLTPRHWAGLIILSAVLAPCKVIYVLISLCCLPDSPKKSTKKLALLHRCSRHTDGFCDLLADLSGKQDQLRSFRQSRSGFGWHQLHPGLLSPRRL